MQMDALQIVISSRKIIDQRIKERGFHRIGSESFIARAIFFEELPGADGSIGKSDQPVQIKEPGEVIFQIGWKIIPDLCDQADLIAPHAHTHNGMHAAAPQTAHVGGSIRQHNIINNDVPDRNEHP